MAADALPGYQNIVAQNPDAPHDLEQFPLQEPENREPQNWNDLPRFGPEDEKQQDQIPRKLIIIFRSRRTTWRLVQLSKLRSN